MMVDDFALNKQTINICYLLPHIDGMFDQLACVSVFPSLDLS